MKTQRAETSLVVLSGLPFLHPLLDIRRGLLHGVELEVSAHFPVVLSILVDQPLQPLAFSLALFPRRFSDTIPCRLFKLADYRVLRLILTSLGYHGKAVPLHLTLLFLKLIQRVIERIEPFHLLAGHAQDSASLWVALDFDFLNLGGLKRLLGDDVQLVRCAVGSSIRARRLRVVEAKEFYRLFRTTGGVVQARCKTETTVVL